MVSSVILCKNILLHLKICVDLYKKSRDVQNELSLITQIHFEYILLNLQIT